MHNNKAIILLKTFLILASLPILILAVKKVYDIRKGASGTPANIVVSTATTSGLLPSSLWQNLSQGGEEAKDMIGPVISQVAALSPELIRVDHLFDYYQVYQGPNNYNFEKLDQVINSIIATGAKPLLSLSYTTAEMSVNNQNAGEPKDWNQWYQLVKATAHRYSVQKNINGIYYEVWNEPDLFGGWHYGKNPNYTNLYIQTARAVKDGAAGANYKIGGPATTAYYANWVKSLFRTSLSANVPLDFISWHKYTKKLEDFDRDFELFNEALSVYPELASVERLITEVGPNSEPDVWYDNQMSAIHLISLSTRLTGKIHRIFSFEVVDGPNKRSDGSSGWGMITHPSNGTQLKPRYHSIKFLNHLRGFRLASTGDGSWVTSLSSRHDDTIQVLLVNYDPRNSHSETVPVSFQQLKPGKYNITITNFMGGTSTRSTQTLSSVLNEHFYLEPNSSILVELSPSI